jgi:hypothetical protein
VINVNFVVDYVYNKTSLVLEMFKNRRIFSGVKGLLHNIGVQILFQMFKQLHGQPLGNIGGAHIGIY